MISKWNSREFVDGGSIMKSMFLIYCFLYDLSYSSLLTSFDPK